MAGKMGHTLQTLTAIALLVSGAALAAPPTPAAPAEVKLHATPARWILTDLKGMTLYTFDRDVTPGVSSCFKACAEKWPPLMAPADAKPMGEWTVIKRADEGFQWAYRDKPLYRFVRDAFAGSQFGERPENDLWHVAAEAIPTPADAKVMQTAHGHILTDFDGMSLYTFSSDKVVGSTVRVASNAAAMPAMAMGEIKSNCGRECLVNWHPLEASWMTVSTAPDWSIALRDDKTRQWVYKGKPLYTYSGDSKPADVEGDGLAVARGEVSVALLEAPPAWPNWVTFASTDGGEVVADPERRTLYQFDAEQNVNRPSGGASERGCNQYCLDFYVPVIAKADAKPVGDWTLITNIHGQKQWAYKGLPLFTYKKDARAGEITGTKNYRVFFPLMRMGGAMQGTGGS